MKITQTPDVDAMIEVSPSEFLELKEKGGLFLEIEPKSRSHAYFWRVQGTWILIVVKEKQDALSE